MLEPSGASKSRVLKVELSRTLASNFAPHMTSQAKVSCVYHGVPVHFHLPNLDLAQKLNAFIPAKWRRVNLKNAIDIYWMDSDEFGTEPWGEDADSDCAISHWNGREIAVQRDFIGVKMSDHDVMIVTKPVIDDGFFNAMRWLLPRSMISNQSVLLHSSCVVNERGFAYFFLGPSGAGKTTIASLARSPHLVLGDDMNVLKFTDNNFVAEAGALGQRISEPRLFGQEFPVKAFFWLKQSRDCRLQQVENSKSARYLLSSCANLFWQEDGSRISEPVLSMISKINTEIPLYELDFDLSGQVWRLLHESL